MKKPKLNKSFWPVVAIMLIVVAILGLSAFVGYEVNSAFGDDSSLYSKLVSALAAIFVAALGFMGVHELLNR